MGFLISVQCTLILSNQVEMKNARDLLNWAEFHREKKKNIYKPGHNEELKKLYEPS
jgi:hypothetical protein